MQNKSYTYILTNNNGKVMYIGVTADLFKRIKEHISGIVLGFTAKTASGYCGQARHDVIGRAAMTLL